MKYLAQIRCLFSSLHTHCYIQITLKLVKNCSAIFAIPESELCGMQKAGFAII